MSRPGGLSAVIGLGANLGDRVATFQKALRELALVAPIAKVSRCYTSAPLGGPIQPEFLNAAALVHYEGSASELLDALLAIEARLGRARLERWGPRVIDLDLLWAEGLVVDTRRLRLPHPRLAERAFALLPMLEIVPGARDPRTGRPYVAPPGDVRLEPEGSKLLVQPFARDA
ncbi:MAG: 2-amino-4-hydroxy-6-hydroxymethyldihydropteridine diphosphokinase [Myxococcota bacterium]|nr:2-amino-4-hydroxy-6-hydroxymethyldihydropteridine diphosphokinase [Myxococcota bacterium]